MLFSYPKKSLLFLVLLATSLSLSAALTELGDDELSQVSGQDGMVISSPDLLDDQFNFMFSDPDGTPLYPTVGYFGFEDFYLDIDNWSVEIDVGANAAFVPLGNMRVAMDINGLDLGTAVFDANWDSSTPGAFAFSADKTQVMEFAVNTFDTDSLVFFVHAANPLLDFVYVEQGQFNLWDGSVYLLDKDGYGNAAYYAPGDEARFGMDFVWGAQFDESTGDVAAGVPNDPDNIFSIAGTTVNIVGAGMEMSIPALLGNFNPAHHNADAPGHGGYVGFGGVFRNVYFGDDSESAFVARYNMIAPSTVALTVSGKDNGGIRADVVLGDIQLDYMQFIDNDGANYTDAYGIGRDYSGGSANCKSAASNCGAIRVTGEMYAEGYVEFDIGATTLDVDEGAGVQNEILPAMRVEAGVSNFSAAINAYMGYDDTVNVGDFELWDTSQNWGEEMRITNGENLSFSAEGLFHSPRNSDVTMRDAGTGFRIAEIRLPEALVWDFEYKDQNCLANPPVAAENNCNVGSDPGSDVNNPADNSYDNNRIRLVDISPVGGDLVLSDMVVEVDKTRGLVLDWPTLTGSMQIGNEGDVTSGIILNGQSAARILFEEWNVDWGQMSLKAH